MIVVCIVDKVLSGLRPGPPNLMRVLLEHNVVRRLRALLLGYSRSLGFLLLLHRRIRARLRCTIDIHSGVCESVCQSASLLSAHDSSFRCVAKAKLQFAVLVEAHDFG